MSEYSDYVILIDENGQPYIAHSIFSNARQKGAKYIQKIKDGAKTRYFYTKAELEAYYNKGKQATKEAASKAKAYAKDKLGYDEKERLDRAKTRYERAQRNARAGAKNLASVVSRGLKTNDYLSDIPGFDDAIKRRNKGYREEDEFREKYVNAQQDYDKTPLGRLDQLKKAAKDTYDDVDLALWKTGKKIRELADTANDWLYDKYLDVDIASDNFKAAVKDGAKEIKKYASDKITQIKDVLGYDEKQRYEDARDYWDRTINLTRPDNLVRRTKDGAIDNEANSKQQRDAAMDLESRKIEYYNTPIGKIPEAREKINTAYGRTYNRVTDKIDEIRSSAKATVEKIERERDFAGAPKAFKKLIEKNSKNLGISKEEAKQRLIDWTTEYYTNANDLERRDKYLEAINSINV